MLSDHSKQSGSLAAPCYRRPPVILHRTPPAGETSCSPQVSAHCNSGHPMLNVCQYFREPCSLHSQFGKYWNPLWAGGALLLSAGSQLSAPQAAYSETDPEKRLIKVQYLSAIAKNSQKQAFKVRLA